MLSVEYIMTSNPYTLGPANTVVEAFDLFSKHQIRHIPILDASQQLVGIVSQRRLLQYYQQPETKLVSLMSKEIIKVNPQHNLRHAALLMQKHRIGSLPVVDGDKLVGIITDTDFVGVAINLLEQLELSEPEQE